MIDLARRLGLERARAALTPLVHGTLFRKYVLLIGAAMAAALALSSLTQIWFTARDHRAALIQLQEEQAKAAAARISQFIEDIEAQLGWMTHLSWAASSAEQREVDALRLMRQVPAITELMLLDGAGRERLWVSRQAMDRVDSRADHSADESFRRAIADKKYYGPVVFRRGSEPTMTLAVSGTRQDAGVAVAEVNLTLIWDVIHRIAVGHEGRAYVVGPEGRLIAHPDISLVLRNIDMLQLDHVRARLTRPDDGVVSVQDATNIQGERVLTASAIAQPLGWTVFVEIPEREANQPLHAALFRSGLIAMIGLLLTVLAALLLARHMVVPIQNLSDGAARIGAGALDHRISIRTGDELDALGRQFNTMADRLQASYLTLERKVQERTEALQAANLSKSRFLAVASHDLRQPLHALNLLVAQLSTARSPSEHDAIAARVDAAIANMNELFNALLDISKLDAGAMVPTLGPVSLSMLLSRIEETFGEAARDKGLHFAVVQSGLWVRSDAILLERIVSNLVSNAVRCTINGGVVVGCRRIGASVRIDVCDTGIGIPRDQQRAIFAEFHRGAAHHSEGEGLGLGLAIVDRLCTLLEHKVDLASAPGQGTRVSVSVPVSAQATTPPHPDGSLTAYDPLSRCRVAVIDDDRLVLDATAGLLRTWGCDVISGPTAEGAMAGHSAGPDLVISDYHLEGGRTGLDEIVTLRARYGHGLPAIVITGDVTLAVRESVEARGLPLLYKPLSPMTLRATATRVLADRNQLAPT